MKLRRTVLIMTVHAEDDSGTNSLEFSIRGPDGSLIGPAAFALAQEGNDPSVAALADGDFTFDLGTGTVSYTGARPGYQILCKF